MGRLTRMCILTAGLFLFTACLSTRRTSAPLSETKSLEEASRLSIGMLMLKNDSESTVIGQGTIFAETADQYVGLTSLTALKLCLPQGEVQNHCWFRVKDMVGKAKILRVNHYAGEAKLPVDWSEFSNGQPVSLAMFGINKRHAAHILKPIEINTAAWPKSAIPAKVVAFSGGKDAPGATLHEQMATAWGFKDELIYTSAQIGIEPEGAPLFVYVPSQTDMRMLWRLAGIVGRDKDVPVFMARSLTNLSVIRKKYPELAVWRRMNWDEKSLPPSSGVIDIQSLVIEKTSDKELFKITLKQSDFKEQLFSVLGFSLRNQDRLDVKIGQGVVTIEFEAEKALREKHEQLKWIYFEYFDADEKPIFTACMPRPEQSKDYTCGMVPLG